MVGLCCSGGVQPNYGLVVSVDHEDEVGLWAAGGLPYVTLSPVLEAANLDFDSYLVFMGRLIGLSLRHGVPLGVCLAPSFCKLLVGQQSKVCFDDLRYVAPRQWQALDRCRHATDETAEITSEARDAALAAYCESLGDRPCFVVQSQSARLAARGLCESAKALHQPESELVLGGFDRQVQDADLDEYCTLLAQEELVDTIEQFAARVRVGLLQVVELRPNSAFARSFRRLSHDSLAEANMGQPEVDVEAWRARTEYMPEGKESEPRGQEVIDWFWDVVEGLSHEERGDLLFFCCSYRRLPARADGWFAMRISLIETSEAVEYDRELPLPSAHTCDNMLVLPLYRSREALAEKLWLAIASAEKAGFGFI